MATREATSPFLTECATAFADNIARIEALARLSEAEANRCPEPGKWSVAQCIDHAVLSIELYLPAMKEALTRGRERNLLGESGLGRGTLMGRMLLGALDPDRKKPMKLRAPRVFRPSESNVDWAALLERSRAAHRELQAIAENADGLDIDRIRHRSPVSFLIRLSLAQALHLHAIHVDRHLNQADRVISALSNQ